MRKADGMRSGRTTRLLVAAVAVLTACSSDAAVSPPAAAEEVLVSAAASLSDVFTELAHEFEAANPTVDVVLNLAGSATLREQVLAGAPVDVFAAASTDAIEPVVAAGLAEVPSPFATNRLVVAVPPGNPAGVGALADLTNDDLLVGLCADGVPCGDLARRVLDLAGVAAAVDTEVSDVRALVTLLALGELDVGLVYATDVTAVQGAVDAVPADDLPEGADTTTTYALAALHDAPNPDGARAFVDFVLSDAGRDVLDRHGFGGP